MIKITKKECKELRELGVKMGENGISKTLSGKYYMCTSGRNMKFLNNIRKDRIVYTKTK